ncbi:MAG TPA: 2-dehydro-3-deoxyglucarate aldolase [Candidatus Agrococcus pullicola]|uniref:2-dehydro-3-deoxyglucarate aldolase n=1 Tax=Candidatus Agrococcus pullicola TaxID=2838429 RepID=A0A9D2C7G5_9MICO|nr:2-dehydro-3-deoxyglucarate aldolase [Candidatus Agrococcus pullicola]
MRLSPVFRDVLAEADGPLVGLWTASGSPVAAEIVAGSGADLLLVDGEHGPIGVDGLVPILQAVAPYAVTPIVRLPWNDHVLIKQFLDAGAQNVLVPMVSNAEDAGAAVRAVRYPGAAGERAGARGIGSALARSARWGRVSGYVNNADRYVSLTVQIETVEGARNAAEIAAVDGVDALFIGPADLAGSMGHPGNPSHPDVVAAVDGVIDAVSAVGKPVGVNAFNPADADRVVGRGAEFVFVSADVTLMAQGSDAAVTSFRERHGIRSSGSNSHGTSDTY